MAVRVLSCISPSCGTQVKKRTCSARGGHPAMRCTRAGLCADPALPVPSWVKSNPGVVSPCKSYRNRLCRWHRSRCRVGQIAACSRGRSGPPAPFVGTVAYLAGLDRYDLTQLSIQSRVGRRGAGGFPQSATQGSVAPAGVWAEISYVRSPDRCDGCCPDSPLLGRS